MAINKIKNILVKMLANEMEWANESMEFIVMGSSVCVPIFLAVAEGFASSLIPIQKKSI